MFGAGEEIRTPDIFLGKEVLYQLSYARAMLGFQALKVFIDLVFFVEGMNWH